MAYKSPHPGKKYLQSMANCAKIPEHYAWEADFPALCPEISGLAGEMKRPEVKTEKTEEHKQWQSYL